MRGTIIFFVFDKYEMPIQGVKVILANKRCSFKGTTNNMGSVIFFDIPLGEYSLKVNRAQYKRYFAKVKFSDNTLILNVKLKYLGDTCIYGNINDKKKSVDYATVVLYAKNAHIVPVDYAQTDEHGNYVFCNVPPKYIVDKSNKVKGCDDEN